MLSHPSSLLLPWAACRALSLAMSRPLRYWAFPALGFWEAVLGSAAPDLPEQRQGEGFPAPPDAPAFPGFGRGLCHYLLHSPPPGQ